MGKKAFVKENKINIKNIVLKKMNIRNVVLDKMIIILWIIVLKKGF